MTHVTRGDLQLSAKRAGKVATAGRSGTIPAVLKRALSHPTPAVSVIIPCREERDHIGPCLDSILANDFPKDRLEILVVDGMSKDGTREIVQDYARRQATIQMLDNPRQTVPAALNLGIARASGSVILRMDAHVACAPDYISSLVNWLQETGADNVGSACVTVPANRSAIARAIAAALAHPFGVGDARFRLGTSKPRWVDTVPFGCFRREIFERVGRFDEELVRNQDDEFNLRLIRAGGRVLLVPGVRSHYSARGSLGQLAQMYYQYGYFKPLVARKVGGVMTARQLVPPIFVSTLILTAAVAPWLPGAGLACICTAGAYTAANIAASTVVGLRQGVRVGLALPAVFATLHLAYGAGFLAGCVDFLLLRKRGRAVSLSR